jgi:hypothetical protein
MADFTRDFIGPDVWGYAIRAMDENSENNVFSVLTIPSRLADQDLPAALRENFSDQAAAVLRGTLGNLPMGGALIAELVGRIIPNQREERMCAFLAGLARKIEATGRTLDQLLSNIDAEKVALFEDGAAGAVKATTEQRIQHLVDLVAQGLGANGREAEDQRALVRLLNDLTETDLRYLMSWTKTYNDDQDWRRKHGFDVRFESREVEVPFGEQTISVKQPVPIGDVMDPIAEMSIQGRLEALGLFEKRVIQAHDGGTGRRGDKFEYDFNISDVGLALLRKLGLIGPDDERAHRWQI